VRVKSRQLSPPVIAVERYSDPGFLSNKIKANERLLVGLFYYWSVVRRPLSVVFCRLPTTDHRPPDNMNIALIGYGKMGRMVEQAALARGHAIAAKFDIDNNVNGNGLTQASLAGIDCAIDFSIPEAVLPNIEKLMQVGVPTVIGATGWYDKLDAVKQLVAEHNGALVWGANFSIGMNLFFKTIHYAAELFARFEQYDPFLLEHHHKFKLDAPSGTALVLERLMRKSYGERTPHSVSIRAGYAPGRHEVGFDSEADHLSFSHTARSRQGFAVGAVVAAELLQGHKGCFEFPELLFEEK
jgi:4-hydroxy-tetrahydrodipicolinate reductase